MSTYKPTPLWEFEVAAILAAAEAEAAVAAVPGRRDQIVESYRRLRLALQETIDVLHSPGVYSVPDDMLAGAATYAGLTREALDELAQAYFDLLPRVALARCPFTGDVARIAVDTFGLDGPWWDSEDALRPPDARLRTVAGFTGALRIAGRPERTSHLVQPGPGVPWVSPALLSVEGVQAVIRAIDVGRHSGWSVVYFADGATEPGWAEWGTTAAAGAHDVDRDYDLGPWIEQGRLAWIGGDDETLTLRRDVERCPYLGLPGERGAQQVRDGVVWTSMTAAPALELRWREAERLHGERERADREPQERSSEE